ncbi:uncharacterized protein L203_101307 [Cryptococcus depauperatus CBS 7841]|uniref:1-phosphatidylinositol 4-kinase n=1 Tax=Cryptococcus depauperatus CBS 7841 TaxID=1295531 RepID=A0AAJ8M024_9TREE
MSHALLLRLFLSPYFSMSIAMQYLKTYPESIGISHYLCWRMKRMPPYEIDFYWPQICHLLLTYPTQSNALESFIMQRAEESTHSVMLTFWFMQAALQDLISTRQSDPVPFAICQRVLHRCHSIIFGDPPQPSRSPYLALASSSTSALESSSRAATVGRSDYRAMSTSINSHIPAALVGMGVILAGTPGMPSLVDVVGEWAVTQGQRSRNDIDDGRDRVEANVGGGADVQPEKLERRTATSKEEENEESDGSDENVLPRLPTKSVVDFNVSIDREMGPAQTAPSLYSPSLSLNPPDHLTENNFKKIRTPRRKGSDPFGQLPLPELEHEKKHSSTPPKSTHQPFCSVPDLYSRPSAKNDLYSRNKPPFADAILATYNLAAQRQLLKSHYCRSEVRFFLLLDDISSRLLVIPKPARVSALRAELTSLNHYLPAEICMPLWCTAEHSHETPSPNVPTQPLYAQRMSAKGHSRIVRISPGESVVLNSAGRVPYLIHVEILEGDLNFDPTKRENRELLKKIVVQEDMKKRRAKGIQSSSGETHGLGNELRDTYHAQDGFGSLMPYVPVIPSTPTPEPFQISPASSSAPKRSLSQSPTKKRQNVDSVELEEVDLVEQLYGAKLSVHDQLPDLSETLPLPNGPKNKQLDLQAWDRRSPASSRRESYSSSTVMSPMPASIVQGDLATSPTIKSPSAPGVLSLAANELTSLPSKKAITLEDYSERMRTAAVMLAQLNAPLVLSTPENQGGSWIPDTGWITGKDKATSLSLDPQVPSQSAGGKFKLAAAQAAAIRERIMHEMMSLEEERVQRMTDRPQGADIELPSECREAAESRGTAEDEGIVRRELNKADPSAAVLKESWTAKKSRIRASSPWGHLANWDVISVIVKSGADLRQEQLATQLIEQFSRIWKEEKSDCWARFFRILITGEASGLVETVTDAVSIHSIKKDEYAKRFAEGRPIGHVSLMDHYVNTFGKPETGRYARAQRNFIRSLAGYSIITYLLQIKDRHNGNILVDHEGHLIHIDFDFMLSNSPGKMSFEAAPFKMPMEYVDMMGGLDSSGYMYFKKLFKEGFEAARKHSDSLITIVELMQKDSKFCCFAISGQQTSIHFRERFQLGLTAQAVDAYLDRLIVSSTGSNYTRLYDTFQYYSQGIL